MLRFEEAARAPQSHNCPHVPISLVQLSPAPFTFLTQWQTQSDDRWLMSIELKLFAASLYGSATTVPTSYSENRASCQTEVARCELGRVDGGSFRGQCD